MRFISYPVLELLKLSLVLGDLEDEGDSLLFELYSFMTHYLDEELIFESFRRDREVDDGCLDAYLWDVVRVREFSRHVELEVMVVWDILIADSQHLLRASLEDLLEEDGFERGIEFFFDVF